jgi:hypothetical protein
MTTSEPRLVRPNGLRAGALAALLLRYFVRDAAASAASRLGSFMRSLCENTVLSTPKLLIYNAATAAKVAFSHRLSAS